MIWVNFSLQKMQKVHEKLKFRASKCVENGSFGSPKSAKSLKWNWFHVKSVWQKISEISTLCSNNSVIDWFTMWKFIIVWHHSVKIKKFQNYYVKSTDNFFSFFQVTEADVEANLFCIDVPNQMESSNLEIIKWTRLKSLRQF